METTRTAYNQENGVYSRILAEQSRLLSSLFLDETTILVSSIISLDSFLVRLEGSLTCLFCDYSLVHFAGLEAASSRHQWLDEIRRQSDCMG